MPTRRKLCAHRRPAARLALVLCALAAPGALGQTTFSWANTVGGGNFNLITNWAPIGGPPGPADNAVFSVINTYLVTFPGSVSTAGLNVTHGIVTFDLDTSGVRRTYNVTGAGAALAVGATSGGQAILVIRDGTLQRDGAAAIGAGGGTGPSALTIT